MKTYTLKIVHDYTEEVTIKFKADDITLISALEDFLCQIRLGLLEEKECTEKE